MSNGIGEQGLSTVLKNAKRLVNPSFDNYKKQSNGIIPEAYNSDIDFMGTMEAVPSFNETRAIIGGGSPNSSKLPKEILESMISSPIDTSALETKARALTGTGSILDTIMPELATSPSPTPTSRPQVMTEQRVNTTPIVNGSIGIDYGVIKSLIDESIRRHLDEYKGVLSEGKNQNTNMNIMSIGSKFQFIDSKGNIFEAKLIRKGNINDKK